MSRMTVAEAKAARDLCAQAIRKLIRELDQALIESDLQVEEVRVNTDTIQFISDTNRAYLDPRVSIILGVTK